MDSIKYFLEISNSEKRISELNDINSNLKNDISTKNAIMTFYDIEIKNKKKDIEEKIQKIEKLNNDIKSYEFIRDKLILNNTRLEKENVILNQKLKDLNIKFSINDKKYIDIIYKKEKYIYVSSLLLDTLMDFFGTISNINKIAKTNNKEYTLIEINKIPSVYEIMKKNIHKYKNNPHFLDYLPEESVIKLSLIYDKKIENIHSLKKLSIHLELKYLLIQLINDVEKIYAEDDTSNKGTYRIETLQKVYTYIDNIAEKRFEQIYLNYKNQFQMIIDQLYDDTI